MKILQLKPKEASFLEMARNLTRRRLDIIFICEGKRDVEVLKGVIEKIFDDLPSNIAVTDCEGKDTISEVTLYTATLAEVSRKLRVISILIDADDKSKLEKANSIVNSLRARVENISIKEIEEDIFKIQSRFNVKILVKVAGDFSLPYEKHTIDDYIVKLLILENEIQDADLKKYYNAKELVNDFLENNNNVSTKDLILQAEEENVQKAFENIIRYLNISLKFLDEV